MARKVNTDQIDQVDEILKHEDPEFMQDLNNINDEELKLAELEAAFAEAEKSNTALHKFWNDTPPKKKWSILSGIFLLVFGPIGYFSWQILTSYSFTNLPSLEPIADSSFNFDVSGPTKNLIDHFLSEEYLYEIHDHVFYLKPKRDIRIGRLSLYLELANKEDLAKAEKKDDEIIETLNLFFSKVDVDDFRGIDGKEAIKRKMLETLRERTKLKFQNVRFSLLVFN
jgi:flagellar basal body-associated protein FliL